MSDLPQDPPIPGSADPDRACPHEHFDVYAAVHRINEVEGGPIVGYNVDVTVTCRVCGEPFRWTGLPQGLSPRWPTTDPAEQTLHAPIRPATADPDFGFGLPGISMQVRIDPSLEEPPEEPSL